MITFPRVARSSSDREVIPFVTLRKGEEPGLANLYILPQRTGSGWRLFYADEDPRDRPVRGMLWARCAFSADADGLPTGEPQWKLTHPYRQMATMLAGRCQVCTRPARTPLGFIFLTGPRDEDLSKPLTWTYHPPVCQRHVRTVERLCPHMEGNPMVFLADKAPLYGALGTVYGLDPDGEADIVASPAEPVPFNDPRAPLLLASQLVRRLSSFRVLDVDELMAELAAVS